MSLDSSLPSKEGKEQKTTRYAGAARDGYTNRKNRQTMIQ